MKNWPYLIWNLISFFPLYPILMGYEWILLDICIYIYVTYIPFFRLYPFLQLHSSNNLVGSSIFFSYSQVAENRGRSLAHGPPHRQVLQQGRETAPPGSSRTRSQIIRRYHTQCSKSLSYCIESSIGWLRNIGWLLLDDQPGPLLDIILLQVGLWGFLYWMIDDDHNPQWSSIG